VKGVFNDVSSVCKQIAMDVHKSEHDLIGLNIIELPGALPLKINNKQDGSFMCAQLFKDLILQTEDHNREDIAMFARPRFSDNPHQLAIISEFEHQYDPSQVIAWYTRNTFLYRMVNKALRTQDHLTIYALRLFIRDLHLKLALLQAENKPMGDKLTLYRGQALSKREFEKLKSNNGGLLSINTFLSTSEDKDIALLFTGGTLENPNIEAILFEICLNPQEVSNVTYANIDQFSVFQGTEKEYLFSMGTVFRIESVDKISGRDVWCVRLTLTTDIDVQLKSLTLHMKQKLQTCDTILLKFVRLMQQMGFQATALQFYLKRYDIRNGAVFEDNGVISYLIGGICLEGQNYEGALHWFQRTLNLMNKQLSGEPLFLCTLYNSIGIAHSSTGNLDLAFEFHQRALELALSLPETSKCTIANSYLHQGEIFAEQDKLDEALILYEKALSLQIVHFPTTHPSIAYTYTCLASLYMKQRKVEQALETYNKSLSLIVASRASNHASIYTTHESISRLLWILSRNEEALQHGLEAMDIYVDAFGLDHPDTQKRQDWVDFLQREISDYNSWYEQQSHEREFQENESD
jgi:tetratricopeptide (TPR) repeat protein